MTLHELRAAAEKAHLSEDYHYDFAELVSPEMVLTLINDRDKLIGAMTRAKAQCMEGGPVWLILAPAIQDSEDTWGLSSGDELL